MRSSVFATVLDHRPKVRRHQSGKAWVVECKACSYFQSVSTRAYPLGSDAWDVAMNHANAHAGFMHALKWRDHGSTP